MPSEESFAQLGDRWEVMAQNHKPDGPMLGSHWGGPVEWAQTYKNAQRYLPCDVVELGPGGGKYTRWLARDCPEKQLWACDYSGGMLKLTKETLAAQPHLCQVHYVQVNGRAFDGVPDGCADLVWGYDVMLHLEIQNVYAYLVDGRRVLRKGGHFVLHQINLLDDVAWRYHFMQQYVAETWCKPYDSEIRRGHIYFNTPEGTVALAERAGYVVEDVVYRQRDIMAHLRKP